MRLVGVSVNSLPGGGFIATIEITRRSWHFGYRRQPLYGAHFFADRLSW